MSNLFELNEIIKKKDLFQGKLIKKLFETNQNEDFINFSKKIVDNVLKTVQSKKKDLGLEYLADNYIWYTKILKIEEVYFAKENSYRYSNFDDVYNKVYGKDDYMFNYVNGLAITQIYWPNHYKIFRFFLDTFLPLINSKDCNCAEIGVGHGLFHAELLKKINNFNKSSLIDISPMALTMTEQMLKTYSIDISKISKFNVDIQKNIPIEDNSLDVLLLGEIVEHIADASRVLESLSKKMKSNGLSYFSTAANGPAEDHILLFNSVAEIREFINNSNWVIVEEKIITINNISLEEAEKNKKNINYCAVIKPIN